MVGRDWGRWNVTHASTAARAQVVRFRTGGRRLGVGGARVGVLGRSGTRVVGRLVRMLAGTKVDGVAYAQVGRLFGGRSQGGVGRGRAEACRRRADARRDEPGWLDTGRRWRGGSC